MATTSQSTLVAIFRSEADARAAYQDLQANGFSSGNVSLSCDASTNSGSVSTEGHHQHEGGITGWFKSLFEDDQDRSYYENAVSSGHVCLTVDATDATIDRVADILNAHSPVDIQRDATSSEGYTGTTGRSEGFTGNAGRSSDTYAQGTDAYAQTTRGASSPETESIPVIEEELRVGKRAVLKGGVRVYSRIVERPVEEQVNLREERVIVDRTPVNRATTAADLRPGQEQVFEVKEYAEEAVVAKESRVVEDVRIRKEATERSETIRDTVRHTEVNVENLSGEQSTTGSRSNLSGSDTAAYDVNAGTYDASATSYDEDDAYRYGSEIGNDPRYRGRSFDQVESDLRSDYGRRYPNSTWDSAKNSIRRGWDKVTGKL